MAEDAKRQRRFDDFEGRSDIQWDNTLTSAARSAIARGDKVSLDYGTQWYWKDNLGQEYCIQTLTICDSYGRSSTIQACIPQINNLRRHEVHPLSGGMPDTHCRQERQQVSSYEIPDSFGSSWRRENLFE